MRLREKVIEQLAEQFHRAQFRLVDDGIVVKIFVEVMAQFQIQLAAFRAMLHERSGAEADIVGGLHAGL